MPPIYNGLPLAPYGGDQRRDSGQRAPGVLQHAIVSGNAESLLMLLKSGAVPRPEDVELARRSLVDVDQKVDLLAVWSAREEVLREIRGH